MFELRLVLEVGLGDLLFRRKSDEHLKKLDAIVEREQKATTQIERIRCEVDFHSTLYDMAGNETLKRFQDILMPVFEYVVEYESKLDHTSVGSVTHADLVKILYSNNAEAYPNAMRETFDAAPRSLVIPPPLKGGRNVAKECCALFLFIVTLC